jgi:flagellar export protein FliJ
MASERDAVIRSERIAGIARLEERKEREAARSMARSRAQLEQVEARLRELRSYRDEYRDRLRHAGGGQVSIAELKRHQLFLRRLDDGVTQAEASAARADAQWQAREREWRRHRARVDALDKVAERHRLDEMRARNRREQRAQDDRPRSAPPCGPALD